MLEKRDATRAGFVPPVPRTLPRPPVYDLPLTTLPAALLMLSHGNLEKIMTTRCLTLLFSEEPHHERVRLLLATLPLSFDDFLRINAIHKFGPDAIAQLFKSQCFPPGPRAPFSDDLIMYLVEQIDPAWRDPDTTGNMLAVALCAPPGVFSEPVMSLIAERANRVVCWDSAVGLARSFCTRHAGHQIYVGGDNVTQTVPNMLATGMIDYLHVRTETLDAVFAHNMAMKGTGDWICDVALLVITGEGRAVEFEWLLAALPRAAPFINLAHNLGQWRMYYGSLSCWTGEAARRGALFLRLLQNLYNVYGLQR